MPGIMSDWTLVDELAGDETGVMATSLIPKVHSHHRDGVLDVSQRWRLTTGLLMSRFVGRRRSRPGGLRAELENPNVWRAIEVPRGDLADRAWELAAQHQPAWLLNHGLRTHAWAQAFGVIQGLAPQHELIFAAAMLHDAGLTPAAASPAEHCFAVRGSRYARQALDGTTAPASVHTIAEAIARHLDLQVDVRDGIEAHLLQAGAMADVLGRGLRRLPQTVRTRVLETHPRLGLKDELCRCMQREAAAGPHTRVGCYVRRIGFLDLIRQAPFDE
jgi:hypothetical protein